MSVYFHGSFGLNRKHLAGVLKAVVKRPDIKDKDLAAPFGYGAPFGARYRSWLNKTGIIKLGSPASLTPMGAIVFKNDPKLQSPTTMWFMHHELSNKDERAEAWSYFVHQFLRKHAKFSRKQLLDGLAKKLGAHSMQHFGPGSAMNKVISRKLIECYTEDYALGKLGLLEKSGSLFLSKRPKKTKGPWTRTADLSRAFR